MLVREAQLLNGTKEQYKALDDAIRTAQFVTGGTHLIEHCSPVVSIF
jgi:hypothetical protein